MKSYYKYDSGINLSGYYSSFVFIEDYKVKSIPAPVNGIIDLNNIVYSNLADDKWYKGYGILKTINLGQEMKPSANGPSFQINIEGTTPKKNPHNLALFNEKSFSRFIVILTDRNGKSVILGDPKNGLKFSFKDTRGGYIFNYTGAFNHPSWFANGSFLLYDGGTSDYSADELESYLEAHPEELAAIHAALLQRVLISSIKNNLTTTEPGGVLDARQGKILGDALGGLATLLSQKVNVVDIVNVLTNPATNLPLSAGQGKVLKDLIDDIDSDKQAVSEKNNANGYAGLDSTGKLNASQLPPLAISKVTVVANQAARLALTLVEEGDVAKQTDNGRAYLLGSGSPATDASWVEIGDTDVIIGDVVGLQAALDAKLGLTAKAADSTLFDGAGRPSNFGTQYAPLETIADGGWARPIGSAVFFHPSSVGSPFAAHLGYWFVIGARDLGSGYAGIAIDYNTGELYAGQGGTSADNPTWVKMLTSGDIVNVLTSSATALPLSAAQGKALKDTADALATTVSGKQSVSEKNVANGYAGLDSGGKLNASQLPPLAISKVTVVANQAARLALTLVEEGDVAKQTDNGRAYLLGSGSPATDASWVEIGDTDVIIGDVAGLQAALDAKIAIAAIVNVLTSTSTTDPLSAAQGKVLKDLLDLKAILSGGNSFTGQQGVSKNAQTDYATAAIIAASGDGGKAGIALVIGGIVGKWLNLQSDGNLYWDTDKIITQTDMSAKQSVSEKNNANGYPGLDSGGKLNASQLPPLAISKVTVVANQAARLALTLVEEGDVAKQTDNGRAYLLGSGSPATDASWVEIGDTDVIIGDVVGLQAALDAKLGLTAKAADSTLFDGASRPSNFGTQYAPLETIADGGWARPIGSSVFFHPSSVGSPFGGHLGWWFVIGARDVASGYAGIALDFSTGELYAGQGGTSADNPTWVKMLTSGDIVNVLTSSATALPLSAAQGKALKDTADALATTVSGKQSISEKNVANGYAGLDSGGKLNASQLPPLAITSVRVVANESERLSLTDVEEGDAAKQSDNGSVYLLGDGDPSDAGNWVEISDSEIIISDVTGLQSALDAKIAISAIVNVLTSTSTTAPLSAAQGKALKDLVDTKLAASATAADSTLLGGKTLVEVRGFQPVSDKNIDHHITAGDAGSTLTDAGAGPSGIDFYLPDANGHIGMVVEICIVDGVANPIGPANSTTKVRLDDSSDIIDIGYGKTSAGGYIDVNNNGATASPTASITLRSRGNNTWTAMSYTINGTISNWEAH